MRVQRWRSRRNKKLLTYTPAHTHTYVNDTSNGKKEWVESSEKKCAYEKCRREESGRQWKKIGEQKKKKAIWCLWIGVRKCVVPSTWKPTNTITTALVLFGIFISCDSPLPNRSIFFYFFPSTFPVREILRFHISFCIEILFALSLSINMSVASESFSLCIPNRNGFESGCV